MTTKVKALAATVVLLPPKARTYPAEQLLASLDEEHLEQQWIAEAIPVFRGFNCCFRIHGLGALAKPGAKRRPEQGAPDGPTLRKNPVLLSLI